MIENFRIPGTWQTIDWYLPEVPRAAILAVGQVPVVTVKERMHDVLAAFGERLLIFLLLPSNRDRESLDLAADPQVFVLHLPLVPTAADLSALLDKIQEVRKRRVGLYSLAAAVVGVGIGMSISRLPTAWVLGKKAIGAYKTLRSGKQAEEHQEDDFGRLFGSLKSTLAKAIEGPVASHLRPRLAKPTATDRKLGQDVEAIMTTLSGLIGEPALATIRSEANSLLAEYDVEHYTACALRAGRCLEAIIYLVAREWQVPIDEPTVACLEAIDSEVLTLRRLIIDYDPAATKCERQRKRIVETANNVNKHCNIMLVDLQNIKQDANATPGAQRPSRNLQAILRDIRRRYGQSACVRNELDKTDGLIKKVIVVRNDAAHADPHGDHREVSATTVDGMVENILEVMQSLSNVGCELYEAKLLVKAASTEA